MSTSSRVVTETNITETREAVSPNINILWNPETDGGRVIFHLQDMVKRNDVYQGLERHTRLISRADQGEMNGTIAVSIEEIKSTPILLGGVEYPGILLMGLIKSYFEQKFTQRILEQEAESMPVGDE